MDSTRGGTGSGGDDNGEASENRKRQRDYERRSSYQKECLEEYFKKFPHPDADQRVNLGRHLGLDANQIKFWFQNRRTQTKKDNERDQNNALQQENQELILWNRTLKQQLEKINCLNCDGPTPNEDQAIQMLMAENEALKKERDLLRNIISSRRDTGNISQGNAEPISLGQRMQETIGNTISQYQFTESQKEALIDICIEARNELFDLLRLDEPMWMKSPLGVAVYLSQNTYKSRFRERNHSQRPNIRTESSKERGCVEMSAVQLINKFIDVDTWMEVFPEIVTKAEVVCKIENPRCSIYAIHEKIHTLSPFVTPRECVYMRHCHQLDENTWMIVDVSHGHFNRCAGALSSLTWKLPSGCIIRDLSNGYSEVTWVEHVQVDDRYLTYPIYWDLITGCQAYGARRWITTLHRMCQRFQALAIPTNVPPVDVNNEWDLGCKKRVLKVSERMVKNFCKVLSMEDELDVPYFFDLDNGKIRASFYKSFGPGQPTGLILRIAASFTLPIPFDTIFYKLKDRDLRPQWDILCKRDSLCEIAHIRTGNYFANDVAIFQPKEKENNNMVIFQESLLDSLGGMLVYAPITHDKLQKVMNMDDGTKIALLPSGLVISGDGRNHYVAPDGASSSRAPPKNGSILTVALQFLLSADTSNEVNKDSFDMIKTLFCSTIHNVKMVLGFP